MKVLVTGMSGAGKSSVIATLASAGHRAFDLDDNGFSEWVPCDGDPTGANPGHDWLWNEKRIDDQLRRCPDGALFLAGCAPNMGKFVPQFDRIILLSASAEVLLSRIESRSNNNYGKAPAEVRQIVENLREVEPRLRRIATLEVDASKPLAHVVAEVLKATA